ncbi:MAG: class I SAM-dependent methyltransferase [candidate division NC10 bacterium]|nr:class I SAM-dependent methyltransferase [candidate division NC10 bacterium]
MPSANPFEREEIALQYHPWYERPPGSLLAGLEKKALLPLLSSLERGPLLEVGCGTGYFTAWLAELGFAATGLDRSAPMLKAARERYPRLPFLLASAESLPFLSGSFAAVAFITSLEFIASPGIALAEASRVAKKAILLGVMNRLSPYVLHLRLRKRSPYGQAKFYSIRELQDLLRSCLDRPFRAVWNTAILSPHWGYAPSRLYRGGFIAMRVDFADFPYSIQT